MKANSQIFRLYFEVLYRCIVENDNAICERDQAYFGGSPKRRVRLLSFGIRSVYWITIGKRLNASAVKCLHFE